MGSGFQLQGGIQTLNEHSAMGFESNFMNKPDYKSLRAHFYESLSFVSNRHHREELAIFACTEPKSTVQGAYVTLILRNDCILDFVFLAGYV